MGCKLTTTFKSCTHKKGWVAMHTIRILDCTIVYDKALQLDKTDTTQARVKQALVPHCTIPYLKLAQPKLIKPLSVFQQLQLY